jgi:hypothetical protein
LLPFVITSTLTQSNACLSKKRSTLYLSLFQAFEKAVNAFHLSLIPTLYLSPSFPSLRKHSQACPETQVSQWFCLSPLSKPFKTFKKAVNTYPSRSTLYLFIHPDLQACPEFKAFALFTFNTLLLIPTPRCLSPSKKKAVSAICLSPLIQRVAYLSPSKKAVDCFTYLPKRRSMPFLSPFNTLLIAFKKKAERS